MKHALYLLLLLLAACNNTELQTTDSKTDTSMKSIDSSALINEHTRLPHDSTATGVQH